MVVNNSSATTKDIHPAVTIECPICHSIFQLIHLEPSGMHELLTLLDTAQEAMPDIPLPSQEEIRAMKKEANRRFYEATEKKDRWR